MTCFPTKICVCSSSLVTQFLTTHATFGPIPDPWKQRVHTALQMKQPSKVGLISKAVAGLHEAGLEEKGRLANCESPQDSRHDRKDTTDWIETAAGMLDLAEMGTPIVYQNFPDGASSNRQLFCRETNDDSGASDLLAGRPVEKPGNRQVTPKEDLRASLYRRRKCTEEVLLEALLAAKFSAMYATELVSSMQEFVDRVMIKAAALKNKPEYVNTFFEFRVRVYIDQIGVTGIIRWLKHNGLTIPRIGKLTFLVEDYVAVLQPKIIWLKSIHVRGRDLGTVLTKEPGILEQTTEELESTVEFLQIHGLRRDWIGLVVRLCPKVLSLGNVELQQRVAFFEELGITADKFGTVVFNFPAILAQFSLEEMHSKVDFLKGFGLESCSVGQAIAIKPELIACNVEDDWTPLVDFLYYLGVQRAGLRRIFTVHPSVFCLNLMEIVPKVQFLRAIGVHEEAIGDVIVKFPAFLTYSLDKKIRPVVRFLLDTAGVAEKDVGKVFAAHPELLQCSLPNKLEVLVKYFLTHGIQRRELGIMVADFPMLIKYSLPVIRPKFKYFKKRIGRPITEIVGFPRFFSYSLESRIVPRHKILQDKGLHFNLKYMLACSDEEFKNRVEAACSNMEVFKVVGHTPLNKHMNEQISIAGHKLGL